MHMKLIAFMIGKAIKLKEISRSWRVLATKLVRYVSI